VLDLTINGFNSSGLAQELKCKYNTAGQAEHIKTNRLSLLFLVDIAEKFKFILNFRGEGVLLIDLCSIKV
jgi:hypothetical protein